MHLLSLDSLSFSDLIVELLNAAITSKGEMHSVKYNWNSRGS